MVNLYNILYHKMDFILRKSRRKNYECKKFKNGLSNYKNWEAGCPKDINKFKNINLYRFILDNPASFRFRGVFYLQEGKVKSINSNVPT